jgi:cytochrome c-type biogenesis protein
VERYLKWSTGSRGLDLVKKVCGILIILGGVYLIRAG